MQQTFVPQAAKGTSLDQIRREAMVSARNRARELDHRATPRRPPMSGSFEHWYVLVRLERCAVDISALLRLLRSDHRVEGGEAELARRMFRRIKESLRSQCATGGGACDSLTDLGRRYHDTIRAAFEALRSKVHTVPGARWVHDLASAHSIIDTTIHELRNGRTT
jgi:hypothetical protein